MSDDLSPADQALLRDLREALDEVDGLDPATHARIRRTVMAAAAAHPRTTRSPEAAGTAPVDVRRSLAVGAHPGTGSTHVSQPDPSLAGPAGSPDTRRSAPPVAGFRAHPPVGRRSERAAGPAGDQRRSTAAAEGALRLPSIVPAGVVHPAAGARQVWIGVDGLVFFAGLALVIVAALLARRWGLW